MKKSLIATAGVAAFAVAAVPAGVFAATGSTEFTDNLSVDVSAGCTMENGGNDDGVYVDRNFSGAIATGNYAVLTAGGAATDSGTITIKCNTTSGTVTVKATPANTGNLKGTTDATKTIAPGAATTGSTSGWAIKSNSANATDAGWADYAAAPVAEATFFTSTASANGTTFNPSYRVYVAQGQAPDTYTGSVTYAVSYTAGS